MNSRTWSRLAVADGVIVDYAPSNPNFQPENLLEYTTAPPPVIDMARVIAYAVVDSSVEWTGTQQLYEAGQLVGAVPGLALCQNISGDLTDILLFHCNEEWEVTGCSGGPTLENAKAMAERAYRGISAKWIHMDTTPEQAERWIREHHADMICSFCGKLPAGDDRVIQGQGAKICSSCVRSFRERLAGQSGA